MKALTKAEEEVMHHLWNLEKAFVKELLAEMPEPKPAYNTVSTIIRILEKKKFVSYESFGKSHRYFPIISRDEYKQFSLTSLVGKYFDNRISNLVSFFAGNEKLSDTEIKQLEELLKNQKK